MWWPTPLPKELAQPSVINGDKVKNVVTKLPSPKNWPNPLCLMMTRLKVWWPTPLPQELAQSSLFNDDRVKNVVTYSPPPRTGPALCT